MYAKAGDDFLHVSEQTKPVWELRIRCIRQLTPDGPPSIIGVSFHKIERDHIDTGDVVLTPEKARAVAVDLLTAAAVVEVADRKRDGQEPDLEDDLPPALFESADQWANSVLETDEDTWEGDRLATFNLARCWRALRRVWGSYPKPGDKE